MRGGEQMPCACDTQSAAAITSSMGRLANFRGALTSSNMSGITYSRSNAICFLL
jgi:hypothetical protein